MFGKNKPKELHKEKTQKIAQVKSMLAEEGLCQMFFECSPIRSIVVRSLV